MNPEVDAEDALPRTLPVRIEVVHLAVPGHLAVLLVLFGWVFAQLLVVL